MKKTSLAFALCLTLAACSPKSEAPKEAAQETAAPAAAVPAPEGSFKIGELSAIAVRDGAFEFPNDNKIFAGRDGKVTTSKTTSIRSAEQDTHPVAFDSCSFVRFVASGRMAPPVPTRSQA